MVREELLAVHALLFDLVGVEGARDGGKFCALLLGRNAQLFFALIQEKMGQVLAGEFLKNE